MLSRLLIGLLFLVCNSYALQLPEFVRAVVEGPHPSVPLSQTASLTEADFFCDCRKFLWSCQKKDCGKGVVVSTIALPHEGLASQPRSRNVQLPAGAEELPWPARFLRFSGWLFLHSKDDCSSRSLRTLGTAFTPSLTYGLGGLIRQSDVAGSVYGQDGNAGLINNVREVNSQAADSTRNGMGVGGGGSSLTDQRHIQAQASTASSSTSNSFFGSSISSTTFGSSALLSFVAGSAAFPLTLPSSSALSVPFEKDPQAVTCESQMGGGSCSMGFALPVSRASALPLVTLDSLEGVGN